MAILDTAKSSYLTNMLGFDGIFFFFHQTCKTGKILPKTNKKKFLVQELAMSKKNMKMPRNTIHTHMSVKQVNPVEKYFVPIKEPYWAVHTFSEIMDYFHRISQKQPFGPKYDGLRKMGRFDRNVFLSSNT